MSRRTSPLCRGVLALLLTVGASACTLIPRPVLEQGPRNADPEALAAAGCVEVPAGDGEDRDHVDPADALPPGELYDVAIPAAGPHFGRWLPIPETVPLQPLDVRGVLHNLEHGAVAVWVDPVVVGETTLAFIGRWRDQLGAAGFDNDRSGAAVFVSRVPEGVDLAAEADMEVGVALRAWGVAIDCPLWDTAAADAFVAQHFGSRGGSPESELGPYPDDNGVLLGPPGARDAETTTV